MSRAAVTKSRADKTKGGTSAPTPAVLHEIVAGKYNDQDWGYMLDKDDGDDFITDIVEDICRDALSLIYDKYIERQLLPFTILQAKDAILQIIEWQFLMCDEGEPAIEEDDTWVEDEEPIPAIADCWAQGLVPKKYVAGTTPFMTPEPIAEEPAELEQEEPEEVSPTPEAEDEEDDEDLKVDEPEPQQPEEAEPQAEEEPEPEIKPSPPKEQPKKKKKKFRPYGGRLKSAGLGNMTESLEQTEIRLLQEEASKNNIVEEDQSGSNHLMNMPASCHSILKVQAGRPPGNKDVIYDDQGNVLSVTKLDPSKLPSHFVRTMFTVVDPAVEAAQARLEAMRTGRFVAASQKKKKTKFMSAFFAAAADSKEDTKVKDIKPQDAVQALPAPLIECMEIAPGVVVKEGNRIKRGPRQFGKTKETDMNANLRPLLPHPPVAAYTARDILDCGTPVLKMIRDSPPIPPISQKQMSY